MIDFVVGFLFGVVALGFGILIGLKMGSLLYRSALDAAYREEQPELKMFLRGQDGHPDHVKAMKYSTDEYHDEKRWEALRGQNRERSGIS